MFLDYTKHRINNPTLILPGSKSESNRALILAQFLDKLEVINLSTADDTQVLQNALQQLSGTVDIGHAGTAMRFLTAYYAIQQSADVILTGSMRMQNRPIKPLVDALQTLGADIRYVNKDGYPPLNIKGQLITKNEINIQANISSQYISALLLIAPFLKHGLTINLQGNITSMPYLNMTVKLLQNLGIDVTFLNKQFIVKPFDVKLFKPKEITIESDWSSASYHYSSLALSNIDTEMTLRYFKPQSLQGDQKLQQIYTVFGIETRYLDRDIIHLKKINVIDAGQTLTLNLNDTPDLAQTIVITCLGLGIEAHLSGLHTLKIKETDRLVALKTEIEKLGAQVVITDHTLHLRPTKTLKQSVSIKTYDDHRMAMAFAPLALKVPVNTENPEVVSKSYPNFWENWEKMFI